MYEHSFEIHELPKMSNGSHGSWMQEHRRRKKWHRMVGQWLMGRTPPRPIQRARVVFTRCSSVEPDYDGLVHGFKPIRDALVKWGVLEDDRPRNLEGVYLWEKALRKQGKVRVEIRELIPDTQSE